MSHQFAVSLAVCLVSLGLTSAASAEERGFANRFFVSGRSPGQPSGAKQATIVAVYGVGATSAGVGVWSLVSANERRNSRDEFLAANTGACWETVSDRCRDLNERNNQIRLLETWGLAGVSTGILLTATGITLAQYWDNVQPEVAVITGGYYAGARFAF